MTDRPAIRAESADGPAGSALLAAFATDLVGRYGHFDASRSPSATAVDMGPPAGRFLVVYLDQEPVACGGIKGLDPPRVCELKRMYVARQARGHGIARLLLGALEDAGRDLGYTALRLDTGAQQPEAKKLYESAGYAAIPAYNENPYADFWFEKRLA